VDEDVKPVTWVNSALRRGRIPVRQHFRHVGTINFERRLADKVYEEIRLRNSLGEGPVHRKAKTVLHHALTGCIHDGEKVPWVWSNRAATSFQLSGDLLSEVVEARVEEEIKTPPGINFRADIALFGKVIKRRNLLLGIIELEHHHRFDYMKCLVYRQLGVPVVSVDLSGSVETEITEDWAMRTLEDMSIAPGDRDRKTHVLLPYSLYPIFADIPYPVRQDTHEFIIFVRDDDFEHLLRHLDDLKRCLSLNDKKVLVRPYNRMMREDEAMEKTLGSVGLLAGPNWRDYNERRFIRVICAVPSDKRGRGYIFHLVMASLLNAYYDVLSGYRFNRELQVDRSSGPPVWCKREEGTLTPLHPVHLAEPLRPLMGSIGRRPLDQFPKRVRLNRATQRKNY
jgi:hypothetical protein